VADRYLLESGGVDGYLLEDSSGVLLLEQQAEAAKARLTVLVVRRVEGERRRRGAKAEVRTLRARLWGNTGTVAVTLPAVQGRVEQNGTSVVAVRPATHPTPQGRRHRYGAWVLGPTTRRIASDGSLAGTLGPLAASATGTFVALPTGPARQPLVVARVVGRPRGAKATVQWQQARQWGNTGSVAATLGPLAGAMDGVADWVANGSVTLGAVAVSATGELPDRSGDIASTLGSLSVSASNLSGGGARFYVMEW
jgi:hypothetical protein